MTIREVEAQTGLTRSNIRFYEKENLIAPLRNERNGYRDYSEADVENIKKIAYLRTLEISIEDIRVIMSGKISLTEVIQRQTMSIQERMEELNKAKIMCERMLKAGEISYDELQVDQYVTDLPGYWAENKPVLKLDSVGFLYLWGGLAVWVIITLLCLIIGIVSYAKLPDEIPVQWSGKMAVSFAERKFIFAYPAGCIIVRIFLRPVIYGRLLRNILFREMIAEYLSNCLCFVALSVELFSVLFVHGLAKSVTVVLVTDAVVLLGVLAAAMIKILRKQNLFL